MTVRQCLEKVIVMIRADHDSFRQSDWITSQRALVNLRLKPRCGTVCCTAGNMLIAMGVDVSCMKGHEISTKLQNTIGGGVYRMDSRARIALDDLFSGSAIHTLWVESGGTYDTTPKPGTREYVELGVRHIQEWLKKHPDIAELEIIVG